MKISAKWLAIPLCLAFALPASAHRSWLLPSATIYSDVGEWVTVDAAVSNGIFYFEHFPLVLDGVGEQPKGMMMRRRPPPGAKDAAAGPEGAGGPPPMLRGRRPSQQLTISAPDGSHIEPKNGAIGRYRTSFDFPLDQKGTYKLAVLGNSFSAGFTVDGKKGRVRGNDLAELKKEIPAKATDVRMMEQQRRMETFVTVGAPTTDVLKVTGKGLELQPVTHPNDLFAGEKAEFKMLLDGQPAADVEVSIVLGGGRYRDAAKESKVKTDSNGVFSIIWPEAGMYWLEADARAKGDGADAPARQAIYVATLEVMKP